MNEKSFRENIEKKIIFFFDATYERRKNIRFFKNWIFKDCSETVKL